MLVVSLGAGAQALILGQVQGLGTNTIAVIPGREPSGPSDVTALFSDSLKEKDVVALRNKTNVPYLKNIMPTIFGAGSSSYGANTYQVTIFGATELIAEVFDLHPTEGRFFDESDVLSRGNVTVIVSKVAEHLFDGQDPIGQNIKVKNRSLRVIALLPPSGGGSLFNFDQMILIPYTTAESYILGQKY